jgi:hypothetical protein
MENNFKKRLNFSLPEETELTIRKIAAETGLKMSMIIQRAVKMFAEDYEKKKS